jgi:hypothetical protein
MFIFLTLCTAIWIGDGFYDNRLQPEKSSHMAIAAVNGGNAEASNLRESNQITNWIDIASWSATLLAAAVCFGSFGGKVSPRK